MKTYNYLLIVLSAFMFLHTHHHVHFICEIVGLLSFALLAFNIFRYTTQFKLH